MEEKSLRRFVSSFVTSLLKEDYARGIPSFILLQVASNATTEMRQHLVRHINQTSKNPVEQRTKLSEAEAVLKKLEEEIKVLLEENLMQFIRNT